MNWTLTIFAERSRYRIASIVLVIAISLVLTGMLVGVPDWLCALIAAPLGLILTGITYVRLRNGGFSGAWVCLMVFQFGFGPTLHLSDKMTVNLIGASLGCIPVVLGWFIPATLKPGYEAETA